MNPEEYRSVLEEAVADLRKHGIRAECRGAGTARFIYAERGIRSVEISGVMPGALIDSFANKRDPSSPDFFETLEAATTEAIAWLTNK